MSSLSRRVGLLAGCDPASVASIVAAALPDAEPRELPALVQAALTTRRPAAVSAVLGRLHTLGPAGLEMVALHRRDGERGDRLLATLGEAIPLALRSRDPVTARLVIDLVSYLAEPALAGHLVELISAGDDDVQERAARALLDLTTAVVGPCGRRPAAALHRDALDRAITGSARRWREHRQPPVMVATCLLAYRPGPHLSRLLAEEDHPFVRALPGIAERRAEPLVRRNLIRWMGIATLRRSGRRGLHLLAGPGVDAVAEALSDGHLLLALGRRRALRVAVRPVRSVPPLAVSVALPPRAQAWLPGLIQHLDLSRGVRIRMLADLVALPSIGARIRVVNALLSEHGEAASVATEPFCFDRAPAVARLARRGLLQRPRSGGLSLLRRLERRGPADLTRLAAARLARIDADRFFDRISSLPDPQRRAAALSVLRTDRSGFIDALARRLHGPVPAGEDAPSHLQLIMIVRRLGLAGAFESELVELTRARCTRTVSAAVAALGSGRGRQGRAALEAALHHRSLRVRANAVESLGRRAAAGEQARVAGFLAGGDNRGRGNAVRVLLQADPPRGVAELQSMLRDEDPLHRISAVWAARRSLVQAARDTVAGLARHDRFAEIRTRAASAVRFLDRTLDWTTDVGQRRRR